MYVNIRDDYSADKVFSISTEGTVNNSAAGDIKQNWLFVCTGFSSAFLVARGANVRSYPELLVISDQPTVVTWESTRTNIKTGESTRTEGSISVDARGFGTFNNPITTYFTKYLPEKSASDWNTLWNKASNNGAFYYKFIDIYGAYVGWDTFLTVANGDIVADNFSYECAGTVSGVGRVIMPDNNNPSSTWHYLQSTNVSGNPVQPWLSNGSEWMCLVAMYTQGAEIEKDKYIYYDIYLNQKENPSITAYWTPATTNEEFNSAIKNVRIACANWVGNSPPTNINNPEEIPVEIGNYHVYEYPNASLAERGWLTTYSNAMGFLDENWWEKLVNKMIIFGEGKGNPIRFYFCVEWAEPLGEQTHTDWCYFDCPDTLPETVEEISTGKLSTNDGSIITIHFGEPSDPLLDDRYINGLDADGDGMGVYDPDFNVNEFLTDIGEVGSGINTNGLLTTMYSLTREGLASLGSFLWGDNFLENLKLVNNNPIENIVSVKAFPFNIGGSAASVKLGNVDTQVTGQKVTNSCYKKVIGSVKISGKYGNFLDYPPYTSAQIYLPYIGYKVFDLNIFMNTTLKVEYITDLTTGMVKAVLYADGINIVDYDANIGIDLPITASNRSSVEVGYLTSALGGVMNMSSGNIGGGIQTILGGALSQNNFETQGASSPSTNTFTIQNVFITYNRPTYQHIASFAHTHGLMCNLTKNIGDLRGFTICNSNVDLSTIHATDAEKEELAGILASGFFV